MARTKIVATIGPSSDNEQTLESMLQAGMDAARLNFSHGSRSEYKTILANLKKLRREYNLAIMADTQGPEIRVSPVQEDSLSVQPGQTITIGFKQSGETDFDLIADHPELTSNLNQGHEILIGDGEVELEVSSVDDEQIRCTVTNKGEIGTNKGLNISQVPLSLPTITEEDKSDIKFALRQGIDFIALSFVQQPEDIETARKFIQSHDESTDQTRIIAKIETLSALKHLDAILGEADGIMVARGDLGMAIDLEQVPFIQKRIIRLANSSAKPVITATEMLQSMINMHSPTRAEVTDVANAVLDGTDALMLSGETAAGEYPVKTVETMYKIADQAENHQPALQVQSDAGNNLSGVAPAIGQASCSIAERIEADAIISSTRSGYTARLISRFRPSIPILAVTPSQKVAQQLSLTWGVEPFLGQEISNTDEMIHFSIEAAKNEGYVEQGDLVVITAGVPFAVKGTTNLITVEQVQ